ncbi:MAG TPA: outer membrane beta-barrel protein [Candidatus Acidoferrales bacterium]|nr:outer membrane beta-barrel protein [Candidatus Acidoferrales bacterium]
MRKLFFIAGLLLFTSGIARAACDRFEVGGSYDYVRVSSNFIPKSGSGGSSSTSLNLNGWNAEVAANPSCWLGIVGNFAGAYASPQGVSVHVYSETFGPRINLRNSSPITPFGEVLIGAAEAGASGGGQSGSQSAFAGYFGGGVDVKLGEHWAARARIDDIMTHFVSQNQNSLGIAAEVVFKFGRH